MFAYLRSATRRGLAPIVASELTDKMSVLPLALWSILVAGKAVGIDHYRAGTRLLPEELLGFFVLLVGLLFSSAYLWSKAAGFLLRRYPWHGPFQS